MLEGEELSDVLNAVEVVPLVGPFHRYVQHVFVAWALRDNFPLHILSGEWSRRTGGRFNFPGRYPTTYLALDEATARVEAEQRIEAPFVHVPIDGHLQHVLDLSDPPIAKLLQLTSGELNAEFRMLNATAVREAPTQRLGLAVCRTSRIEAIKYPSTVHLRGMCLAVFPQRLAPGSYLRITDPDDVLRESIP